ncbi:MAG: hypothetical protein IK077_17000 [Thermoguttaceae bacterium]|nr:hypothetical protein [Thermoguttaceae bacterium]
MNNFGRKEENSLRDGARKAALLLSILDSDVVEKLLALFDPKIVEIIVDEAKRVKVEQISLDEVEPIVNEFLTTFGVDDHELASVLLGEAKRSLGERLQNASRHNSKSAVEGNDAEQVPVSSLDVFEPGGLAHALRGERPTIVASVLGLVSSKRSRQIMELFAKGSSKTFDDRSLAAIKNSSSFLTPSSAMKRLESVFFEHMLEK